MIKEHLQRVKPLSNGNVLALCPFHADHNPSMVVFSNGGFFCHGCGAKGNWQKLAQQLGLSGGDYTHRPETFVEPDVVAIQDAVADKARYVWSNAVSASLSHSYLKRKGFRETYGLKLHTKSNSILTPIFDEKGLLVNLQFISEDGEKKFLKCGKTKGCCCFLWQRKLRPLTDFPRRDYNLPLSIVEGLATGVAVYQVTNNPTVIALNANNLLSVGQMVRGYLPPARIIFFADNDCEKKENVGVLSARKAAAAVNGRVRIPQLEDESKSCDFNDLMLIMMKEEKKSNENNNLQFLQEAI